MSLIIHGPLRNGSCSMIASLVRWLSRALALACCEGSAPQLWAGKAGVVSTYCSLHRRSRSHHGHTK